MGDLSSRQTEFVRWTGKTPEDFNSLLVSHENGRARDRLARRNPMWARKQAPNHYTKGVEAALGMVALVAGIVRLGAQFPLVVIHGRDLELVMPILRLFDLSFVVRYAVTSRPITTYLYAGSEAWDLCMRFQRMQVPVDVPAAHVDTGFKGSVPAWFRKQGWNMARCELFCMDPNSNAETYQMPETASRKHLASSSLECWGGDHRLAELTTDRDFLGFGLRYSATPERFWARANGVLDTLGLPGTGDTRRPGIGLRKFLAKYGF